MKTRKEITVVHGDRRITVQPNKDGTAIYLSDENGRDIGWLDPVEAGAVAEAIQAVASAMKEATP